MTKISILNNTTGVLDIVINNKKITPLGIAHDCLRMRKEKIERDSFFA
jgi:hypothetical protein